MTNTPYAIAATLFAATLSAQGSLELPSSATPMFEMNNYALVPFQQPNARVQMFYGANEVGTLPFVATDMQWRYDGPIPQVGAPGPFSIQQFTIRIGKTSIARPGADFEQNLTEPLTEVFNGPWSYTPDQGSAAPHPWGGPNNSLTWPFSQPVPIVVGPGEWLVVDVRMYGNNIASFGFAHAIVDGSTTAGGVTDGTTTNYGTGCTGATATVQGITAPGAAHFLTGQNLGANAVALGLFGIDDQNYLGTALPFALPGTSCELLTSAEVSMVGVADAQGAISGSTMALALPANPSLNGVSLYEQFAMLAPGANAFGIVFSDAVAVNLGSFATPLDDYYTVAHDLDADATYANQVRAFGYAMRLGTL